MIHRQLRTSPFNQSIAGVPQELLDYARRAYRGGTICTESYELGLWNHPYRFQLPEMSKPAEEFNDWLFELPDSKLADQLNAAQFLQFVEAGRNRYDQWTQCAWVDENVLAVQQEIDCRLRAWESARIEVDACKGEHRSIGEVWLEWGAKIVCSLVVELRVRNVGRSEYDSAFEAGTLPWQCMN